MAMRTAGEPAADGLLSTNPFALHVWMTMDQEMAARTEGEGHLADGAVR
jgi:hypothetical protein